LKDYFKTKGIKVGNIRILRNDKGESKCVGFALCLSDEAVSKALRLDGERFGAKPIRINRASSGRNDSRNDFRGGHSDYRSDYSRNEYRR